MYLNVFLVIVIHLMKESVDTFYLPILVPSFTRLNTNSYKGNCLSTSACCFLVPAVRCCFAIGSSSLLAPFLKVQNHDKAIFIFNSIQAISEQACHKFCSIMFIFYKLLSPLSPTTILQEKVH